MDHDDRRSYAIVAAIMELSRALDLATVAERGETRRQLPEIPELGSDLAQGFYLGRPLPVTDFEQEILDSATDSSLTRLDLGDPPLEPPVDQKLLGADAPAVPRLCREPDARPGPVVGAYATTRFRPTLLPVEVGAGVTARDARHLHTGSTRARHAHLVCLRRDAMYPTGRNAMYLTDERTAHLGLERPERFAAGAEGPPAPHADGQCPLPVACGALARRSGPADDR